MTEILQCCENIPRFKIQFKTKDAYLVCELCSNLPYWSRHIKSKEVLDN